jgi:hypothetical protein
MEKTAAFKAAVFLLRADIINTGKPQALYYFRLLIIDDEPALKPNDRLLKRSVFFMSRSLLTNETSELDLLDQRPLTRPTSIFLNPMKR